MFLEFSFHLYLVGQTIVNVIIMTKNNVTCLNSLLTNP